MKITENKIKHATVFKVSFSLDILKSIAVFILTHFITENLYENHHHINIDFL